MPSSQEAQEALRSSAPLADARATDGVGPASRVSRPDFAVHTVRSANHPAALWARRSTLTVLVLILAAALLSLLGVHTRQVTTTRNGWTMSLRYPGIARSGLDVPWQVTVTHPGGFGRQLTLAVTGNYLDLFETQGFHPQASAETRDGKYLYLTFSTPPGDTFTVYFDTYIQPASQRGLGGRVAITQGGVSRHQVAWIDFRTWLWP